MDNEFLAALFEREAEEPKTGIPTSIRLPAEMKAHIEQLAEKEDLKVAAIVRRLLKRGLALEELAEQFRERATA